MWVAGDGRPYIPSCQNPTEAPPHIKFDGMRHLFLLVYVVYQRLPFFSTSPLLVSTCLHYVLLVYQHSTSSLLVPTCLHLSTFFSYLPLAYSHLSTFILTCYCLFNNVYTCSNLFPLIYVGSCLLAFVPPLFVAHGNGIAS